MLHAAFHVDRRLVCNCLQPQLLISLQPLQSVLGVLAAECYQQLLGVRQFSVGVHRPRGGVAHGSHVIILLRLHSGQPRYAVLNSC